MTNIIEVDADTGESFERPMTSQEKAQQQADAQESLAAVIAEEAARATREAALLKLANVAALTDDEKAALGL